MVLNYEAVLTPSKMIIFYIEIDCKLNQIAHNEYGV
jgi:hypothetical protein